MSSRKLSPESTTQFVGWQPPSVQQLVSDGILLEESKLLFFGRHGTKKSMAVMDLAFAIARGGKWLGFQCSQAKAMVINVEISKAAYQTRVIKYLGGNQILPPKMHNPDTGQLEDNLWWVTEPNLKIHLNEGYRALEAMVVVYRPKVLIIDPIYKVVRGNISNNSDVMEMTDLLDMMAARYGLAIVMVGHTRKTNYNVPIADIDWSQELIGSSFFMNWADTGVALLPLAQPDTAEVHFVKTRNSEQMLDPRVVRFDRGTLKWMVQT